MYFMVMCFLCKMTPLETQSLCLIVHNNNEYLDFANRHQKQKKNVSSCKKEKNFEKKNRKYLPKNGNNTKLSAVSWRDAVSNGKKIVQHKELKLSVATLKFQVKCVCKTLLFFKYLIKKSQRIIGRH